MEPIGLPGVLFAQPMGMTGLASQAFPVGQPAVSRERRGNRANELFAAGELEQEFQGSLAGQDVGGKVIGTIIKRMYFSPAAFVKKQVLKRSEGRPHPMRLHDE